jgi:hypothetical protein
MVMEEDITMVLTMAMVIVILRATATITTVTGILMDINNLAVTGITVTMDQGMVPVMGDEMRGQGELPMSHWCSLLQCDIFGQKTLPVEIKTVSLYSRNCSLTLSNHDII